MSTNLAKPNLCRANRQKIRPEQQRSDHSFCCGGKSSVGGHFLIIPSPSSGAHESGGEHATGGHDDSHGDDGGHGGGHGSEHGGGGEVFVTEVSTSVSTNGGGTIFFVMFKLDAIVSASSKDTFSELITASHKARVKQAIVKVVRMSSMEDLNDPQLDVFKRNLRSEINNILPQRFIEEVIISDFRTMEQ
jgi:hypothetical protein